MTAVIFAGPSLRAEDRARFPGLTFLPPVAQGALYAAARRGPRAIGMIDGFFDGQPAVWHKEILWALSQGIAVFGAASMGALRAAELAPFGMIGVGGIFRDFRDGTLRDDDEVALLHGPAETGYLGLSEPMVNIRATVERALAEGMLDAPGAGAILAAAKGRFYPDRLWENLLPALPDPAARDALAAWLAQGRVDRKRQDALALLDAVQDHLDRGGPAPAPGFFFEPTEAWASAPWLDADPDPGVEAILDELRLDPDAYGRVRDAALLQVLAEGAPGTDPRADPGDKDEALAQVVHEFRMAQGLLRQADLQAWMARNDLDTTGFRRLMQGQAALRATGRRRDPALCAAILDRLRLQGDYGALRDRARAKRQAAAAEPGLPLPLLVAWYFETRLNRPLPDSIPDHAAALGLPDADRFHGILAAEYAFLRAQAS